jgi:broad specificity phosphatase PhoE
LKHLILARHVEGEGDVRRAAWKRGEAAQSNKMPEEEGITDKGFRDAQAIGRYLVENIQKPYGLDRFDGYFTSMAKRSIQTAGAMCLAGADVWQGDERLDERNRGLVRGMHPEKHKQMYPESFALMKHDPLHWIPPGPGGNAIVPHMADLFESFYSDIQDMDSAIIVGHRDQFWAAMRHLEHLSDDEMKRVDTEAITNGYLIYYTSISPKTGQQMPDISWKYTVDPLQPKTTSGWQVLPNVAQQLI